MRTQWNDEEDAALLSVPWRARVVYLQGLRRKMDVRTGISGIPAVVSYQQLGEVLDCTEHSTKPDPRVNKEGLRAIFAMLERAGLVDWIKEDKGQKGLLFFLKLADRDYQHQKQDNPKTTPRQPQLENPKKCSVSILKVNGNHETGIGQDNPKTTPRQPQQDNPPPVSGIREEEEDANASLSTPAVAVADPDDDDFPEREDPKPVPPCPHAQIIETYARVLPELPRPILKRWTGSASAKELQARWREDAQHQDPAFWDAFFQTARTNSHWMGENNRGWKADLHWFVKRVNFDKVLVRMVNQSRNQQQTA